MPKVSEQELEPCAGTPLKTCGRKADPAIKGYDGLWRCMRCNEIHAELVFKEAGEKAPNPGEAARNVGVEQGNSKLARRLDILARARKGLIELPPGVEDVRELEGPLEGETEAQRRARILRKYGRRP